MRKDVFKTWKKALLSLAVTALVTAGLTITAQAGTSFETADPTMMGQKQVLNFETSGDTQYFYFDTDAAPGWYTVNIGNTAGPDKYIYVYATADRTKQVLRYGQGRGGNSTKLLALTPNTRYYVLVEPAYHNTGGSANFTINKINDDHGNDLATGEPIALGTTVTGNIEVHDMGECDTFQFTTTGNNSYYEMALSCTGNNSAYAYIYHGPDASYDCDEISAGSADTRSIVKKLEPNKTYYVKIGGYYWDNPTSYKFAVREIKDDAGNDFADATKLSNGKTTSRTIQIQADTDFFKYKTKKKQNYYVLTFKNKSKSGMDVTVYSNNDIASAINEVNDMYVSGATVKTMFLRLKPNRTYYVKVTGYDNCSYNVEFKDAKSFVKKNAPNTFKAKGYSGWLSKYASLTWNHKYTNAKYEVYRSTSPNSGFKKIKTVQNAGYYTDYGVKKKHTYYYKIKYFVKENGKTCPAKWSKVKKVRIK